MISRIIIKGIQLYGIVRLCPAANAGRGKINFYNRGKTVILTETRGLLNFKKQLLNLAGGVTFIADREKPDPAVVCEETG